MLLKSRHLKLSEDLSADVNVASVAIAYFCLNVFNILDYIVYIYILYIVYYTYYTIYSIQQYARKLLYFNKSNFI